MFKTQEDIINKIHLLIAVAIVVPAAMIYGFYPDFFLELTPETIDERNFHKAIMGLYLGCSVIWISGLLNPKHLHTAQIVQVAFMLSLGVGRVVSILIDGIPSSLYVAGTFTEIAFAVYGIWVLNRGANLKNT